MFMVENLDCIKLDFTRLVKDIHNSHTQNNIQLTPSYPKIQRNYLKIQCKKYKMAKHPENKMNKLQY